MERPFTAELIVEKYLSGVRIDSFLVKHFRNYTSWRMLRIVRAGGVSINGILAGPTQRVFSKQRVKVRLIEPPDKLLDAEPGPLSILAEDPWLIVLNKPPGQIVHPAGNFQSGSVIQALQYHFDRQTRLRGLLRPGIVHRLDRDTSGVMVVTKEHLSHRRLSIQFQRGRVSKSYLALVEGVVEKDEGLIDLPIGSSPGNGTLMSAKGDARSPKSSRTRYCVMERFDGFTLVEAQPLTGRLHQIRVHLSELGHPLMGDAYYGPFGLIKGSGPRKHTVQFPTEAWESVSSRNGDLMDRHALHARSLEFSHPITGQHLQFKAPLPGDFAQSLEQLKPSVRPC